MINTNGVVIYKGPSALDGAPIVAIATGLKGKSRNIKTGHMVQVWILRSDVNPLTAANSGADSSICGGCKHRGTVENGQNIGRSCYVTLFQAPRSIYESFTRGIYPEIAQHEFRQYFGGRKVRFGAYGDPVAVPYRVVESVARDTQGITGYSHQWAKCDQRFSKYLMASTDSPAESVWANFLGWRTFRAKTESAPKESGEIVCPASIEKGKKTSCESCLACGGRNARARGNIVINIHGARSAHFTGV